MSHETNKGWTSDDEAGGLLYDGHPISLDNNRLSPQAAAYRAALADVLNRAGVIMRPVGEIRSGGRDYALWTPDVQNGGDR